MSDNIILNKFTVAGGDTSRFVDRGTAKTQVVMQDWTPAGAKETLLGYPVSLRTNFTTAQTNTALVAGVGGSKYVVTQIQCTLSSAVTVSVNIIIGFGAAATPTTTKVIASHPGLATSSASIGGILSRGDGSGMLGMGADSEGIFITSGAPTTGSMDVTITYYVVPS